jgi:GINS complex subunit 4
MTGTMDPSANFNLIITQTELERFKFLIRSFLRARIAKVCFSIPPFPFPITIITALKSSLLLPSLPPSCLPISKENTTNPSLQLDKYPHHHLSSPNLSTTESQYVTHRCTLLTHHFSTSFLSSFPAQLQKLDDTAGGISMVDAPDIDAAVFVRVLRDAGHVEVQGEQGVGVVELRRGDVWCVRWSAVKEACLRGDVEMV